MVYLIVGKFCTTAKKCIGLMKDSPKENTRTDTNILAKKEVMLSSSQVAEIWQFDANK